MYNITLRNVRAKMLEWKALGITYSKSVFVAWGNKHALLMRYIIICGLPNSTIFFQIIS
jgi:hypothetical protein